jgi:DNA primase catalytic subunit
VAEAVKKSGYNFNGVHAPENPTDNWSLSYEKLVVPLVKAAQELSKQNDEKDTKITELESRLSKLEAMMNAKQSVMSDRLSANNANVSSLNRQQPSASLQQNVPNPFNHSTTINYSLPQQYSSAKMIVVDELGKTIQSINLSGHGKGSINFSSPFRAGASYQYSLFVDGKLMDTKQMILTK